MSSFQKVLPPSMSVSPAASRPASSAIAASVAAPAGSMTQTARGAASACTSSPRLAACRRALARELRAPAPDRGRRPTQAWPCRMSRRAMLAPMRPRPTMPICMVSLSPALRRAQIGVSRICADLLTARRIKSGYCAYVATSVCICHPHHQDRSMTPSDLAYTSAAELARMIRAKEDLRRRGHARHAGARREGAGGLNCFITICARAGARRCRGRRRGARPRRRRSGPCTACRSTSRTSSTPRACARRSAPSSTSTTCPRRISVSVARLKPAGAILFGQDHDARVRAHALHRGAAVRAHAQRLGCRRAHRGGSSGGAAVAWPPASARSAVATDAGGSTRIPAACNGVVGFKQSARRGAARHGARGVRQLSLASTR